ncbi:RidA family protein [Actinomadura viridis]|uniref:Enamine deaminase RidA (YjgF/YER057c/UK114 family) n=1 Tax=Actinomadura viridis TaxID=58110 RepID=A0A931DIT5_9ACTN|nr:Rid family hydrolase [Actinomadura viridis]MBG6089353.1 enamine deaminase RidA (YjgF/YER057c/UK114 family) [Actinomadura viridis]
MSHTITNPGTLHDPTGFGYSHVARASGDLVFIAGQYASGGDGHVTSPDFAAQVDRALENLGTALASAGLGYEDVFQLRTYIVDHDAAKLQVVLERLGRIWGDTPPVQTLLGVAALALPEMLFEIDAIAVARDHS